jgi:integrase
MAIFEYEKNGQTLYHAYVQRLGKKNRRLRLQKHKYGIESREQAEKEEKKLIKLVVEEMAKLEAKGLHWGEILDRWEVSAKRGFLGAHAEEKRYYSEHIRRLRTYTRHWFDRIASDILKGDGRAVLVALKEQGYSRAQLGRIRGSINTVYKWGMDEGLIQAQTSPVEGLTFHEKKEDVPQILTLEECQKLLYEAKLKEHPWYHLWAFALLTGMRSGELMALRWTDIEPETNLIRVSRSYSVSRRSEKSTKAGYWRTVPVSTDLQEIINELRVLRGNEEFVFHRMGSWKAGQAGVILRQFLTDIGIPKDVVFHTLRACFATHLLSTGAEAAKVMAIGGWKDFKTFQIYIRLAGVDTAGATENLSLVPRFDFSNVVALK